MKKEEAYKTIAHRELISRILEVATPSLLAGGVCFGLSELLNRLTNSRIVNPVHLAVGVGIGKGLYHFLNPVNRYLGRDDIKLMR